jgi:DNA polymerase III subunit beta
MTATATKERKTKARSTGSGITITAGELKAALLAVDAAVPNTTPKPILNNVLIGNGLITGTDLELRVDHELGTGEHPPVLLPHQRLKAIAGAVGPFTEVTIDVSGSKATVMAGRSVWTLPTEDPLEFPAFTSDERTSICRLPADQFSSAIKAVIYATDNESSRYALGAVLVEVAGDEVIFVATDGRRLSSATCEHDQAVDDSTTLLPVRAAKLMARLADGLKGEGSVQLELAGGTVVATIGTTVVSAQVTQGRFPRWRDVFPARDVPMAVVDRLTLFGATTAAAIVTSEQSKGLDFSFSATGIGLHGVSSEYGESDVTVEIVEPGATTKIKLDPRFVIQFLQGLPADEEPNVEIEVVDATSAAVFRCGPYKGVVMPLALD